MGIYLDLFKQNKKHFRIGSVEYEGNTYYVREMSAGQKIRLLSENSDPNKSYEYFSKMLVWCLCDKDGNLTENEDSTELLEYIPGDLMDKLMAVLTDVNRLSQAAADDLKKE